MLRILISNATDFQYNSVNLASISTRERIKTHKKIKSSNSVLFENGAIPMSENYAISRSGVLAAVGDADPTILARIRRAIVADKSLSLYAQNVEISVGPRGVTLCGPVKSQEERKRIERGAAAVVKFGKVFSKLVVRSSQNLGQTKSPRRPQLNDELRSEEKCGRIRRLWGIGERSRS